MVASSIPTSTGVTVAAFYRFVAIADPAALQRDLREFCAVRGIKGTILVAPEGINATVSGAESDVAALIGMLRVDDGFSDLAVKFSKANGHPFQRLKVKVKREIVTFGVSRPQPSVLTAPAVEPEDWNALILQPGVLVIDTRNDYEFEVGTFTGARNPRTRSFSEFPDFVVRELAGDRQRTIAMFCKGGIRCEKASAHLLSEGFTSVYQLSGGILKYLERIPPAESLWRGECFVFDERVALEHGVRRGHYGLCGRCGHPVRLAAERDDAALCTACGDAQTVSAGISDQVEPAEF
jgi:UPF0176 protein